MGQFKPMVKMFTDEPSVILKLKKGGKVKAAGQADAFKSMSIASGNPFDDAESGKAPKKPSMAARRKAMNPNQYAKGGKVAHKYVGGAMPSGPGDDKMYAMGQPRPAPMPSRSPMPSRGPVGGPQAMKPMGKMQIPANIRSALSEMAPQFRTMMTGMAPIARSALKTMSPMLRSAREAMVRNKVGGMKKGGSMDCSALEKELKHHESMSASKAHGKASGGEIDAAATKTTLKNSVKPYAKTKMDTAKKDRSSAPTGEVKEGKPGGYKMGGTIEGNEGAYENTKMNTAGKGKTGGSTGGVRMGNAGGFKNGGKAMKYASGGGIDAKMTRTTVEGGNWENRAANTSKPGKSNTTTGEVKKANAGGYKMGGAAKKAYATGGNVVSDGKAEKMPRHFVSRPVANNLQSGTFKKGGNVKKYQYGGSTGDPIIDRENRREEAERNAQKAENEEMREAILGFPGRLYKGAKSMLSSSSTGKEAASTASSPASAASKTPRAITKTKESVTVTPRKRGGLANC